MIRDRTAASTMASEAIYVGSSPTPGTINLLSLVGLIFYNLTGLRTNPAGALATEKWNLVYPATALAMARQKLGESTLPANDSRRRRTNKAKLGGTPPFLPRDAAWVGEEIVDLLLTGSNPVRGANYFRVLEW